MEDTTPSPRTHKETASGLKNQIPAGNLWGGKFPSLHEPAPPPAARTFSETTRIDGSSNPFPPSTLQERTKCDGWTRCPLLADGWSQQQIIENYPGVTHEDISACLRYAACTGRTGS
ncbi:MAG: DUF433 domain-containing protein [Thermoguttaceae bacterium]